MANTFQCDICSKTTHIYPPFEHVFEDKETEYGVVKIPVMSTAKRQNQFTGEVEDIQVQKIRFLKPRAHIIRLDVAGEEVQRDFCEDCVKEVLPEVQKLWDKLASIRSK